MIGQVMNADALELMKMLPDKSIDLVLTDPPYGINYQSNMRVKTEKFAKLENDNNEKRFEIYPELFRVLKDDSVAIVFCSFKNIAVDYMELEDFFDIKNVIVWDKGGGGIGDLTHSLSTDYELAIVAHKGMAKLRGKRYGSVWRTGKVNPNKMIHPTQKPEDIIKKMIQSFSDENNLILDSFMGSFTTAIAAESLGRRWIGCDLSEKYCQVGEERLKVLRSQPKLI